MVVFRTATLSLGHNNIAVRLTTPGVCIHNPRWVVFRWLAGGTLLQEGRGEW